MQITFSCPNCEAARRWTVERGDEESLCPACGQRCAPPEPAAGGPREVTHCLVCGCEELFVRKDFSQKLGVTIVVVGLAASCIPWWFGYWELTFAILFGTAALDAALYYLVTGELLECYRCHAQHRGVTGLGARPKFELAIHERHRQQRIRLARAGQGLPASARGEDAAALAAEEAAAPEEAASAAAAPVEAPPPRV